ncbi:MAG: hypothetical protein KF749_16390 [Bacteroidetes bacterium]|nr:hypothetical protein [Bacteroidota bacterium]MCW5897012.1 hypothetical protein [Bacteroidota bacterium]
MEQLAQIEDSVKALWEKAKRAGDTIVRLREEKQALTSEVHVLRQEVGKLKGELAAREQQLQRLVAAAGEAKSSIGMSNGEREQLTAKVKELLARIDAYL